FLNHLEKFTQLDDTDVMCTIKNWCGHPDVVLSRLSKGLVDRQLLKVKFSTEPFDETLVSQLKNDVHKQLNITLAEAGHFVFTGEVVNTTYNPHDEHIKILYKDGSVSDISKVDNALIHQQVSATVKKYYLCHLK
ncbi:MAG: phosphohydrolase, partial [Bacteroidota bacterium]